MPKPNATPSPPFVNRSDTPTKKEHSKILENFFKHNLQKAVIARKTTLTFAKKPNISNIINTLLRVKSNAHFFALLISPNEAFVGITPESLFIKENDNLFTEALAGTKTLNSNETLFNPKELNEFHLTRDSILNTLTPLSTGINFDRCEKVKKTSNLIHLHTKIHAKLKHNISIKELINILHPTPALGGIEKSRALEFIYKSETFDRGLYAAPFSFTHEDKTHCLVAIRSALIKDNKIHLFSGSGCVKGSIISKEWQELNDKIAPLLNQFEFTKEDN